MYKINKLQHEKHIVRDFSHSLVLYQNSHSIAALTRSISDTSPTKIPYVRAFHEFEVISIYPMLKKIQPIRCQESRCKLILRYATGSIPLCFPAMTFSRELFYRQWLYVRAPGSANKLKGFSIRL